MDRCWVWLGALAMATVFASPAATQSVQTTTNEVDVELVIAVDVSLSMDVQEQALQRDGYVRAFADADVHRAIENGLLGRVAVAYIEWAGVGETRVILDWTLIDGPDAALEFSAALAEKPLSRVRRTSISSAIEFATGFIETNEFLGLRRVIDVSGDGANNQGALVNEMRDRAVQAGIVINGLPFVPDATGPLGIFDLPELDMYYEDCVIGGPGAFSLPVRDKEDFAEGIRNKLLLEISGYTPARLIRTATESTPRIPCDIGERQWRTFIQRMGR